MSEWYVVPALRLACALLSGVAIPVVGMRMLRGTLQGRAPRVVNYRGTAVPVGLGLVWLFWAIGLALTLALAKVVSPLERARQAETYVYPVFEIATYMFRYMPLLLVLGAVAFGWLDDVLGTPDARGFRGHLREMVCGRISGGGLKMIGIGALSLLASASLQEWGWLSGIPANSGGGVSVWLMGAAVIALSANLVNLFDVRPGRSLKVYVAWSTSLLVALALSSRAKWLVWGVSQGNEDAFRALSLVALALLLLGPALAVWRADHQEVAVLGDAGANAMGALAGYVTASLLAPVGLAVATAVLLALNLASERVSFTSVIDRVAVLRWADQLGRPPLTGSALSDEDTGKPDER